MNKKKLKTISKNLKHIPRYLSTWLFGGNWEYGWNPSLIGRIKKYHEESWFRTHSLWRFIKPTIKNWINIK